MSERGCPRIRDADSRGSPSTQIIASSPSNAGPPHADRRFLSAVMPIPRARRIALIFIAIVCVAALLDARRRPDRQLGTRAALAAIGLYQRTLSSWMPAAGIACRFSPTCSRYSAAVIAKYGWPRGIVKTVVRLARCGPWTPAGTVDPP